MSLIVDTPSEAGPAKQTEATNGVTNGSETMAPKFEIDGVDEKDRVCVIQQIEFYLSDANLPFDKFMFLQTSPHLDPIKGPTLSPEATQKAKSYGPGCSPILLQTVASFKRMRPYSTKFPTSKIAQILQTSQTTPKLVEIISEDLNGKPTLYIRRLLKLEEVNRAGASDRCVYVKGFLSDEELAKGEPADMQIKLETWAKQWGNVTVLRMRRDDPYKSKGVTAADKEAMKGVKLEKKWRNSVFIEYQDAAHAEQLVHDFKEGAEKPKFEGRELTPIMFKIDYVTMKATEKGFPPPKMSGIRKASAPTKRSFGTVGGNNTSFNAYEEMKAVADGRKEYVSGPTPKSGQKTNQEPPAEPVRELEYEGNKVQVQKDGTIKDLSALKTFRENLALGFKLKGDAPTNFREARVDFRDLKAHLTEGSLVCNFVHLTPGSRDSGSVGFNEPIDDELFAKIQAKEIKAGGRVVEFQRLNDDENRQYHLECASVQAKSLFGPKDNDSRGHKGNRGDRDNKRSDGRGRGGRRGGRRDGPRDGPRDRNAEKSNKETPVNTETTQPHDSAVSAHKKRDAEGNIIGVNGNGVQSVDSVPNVSRAEKKIKLEET